MGTIGARKATAIVDHVKIILGIELLCGAQAIDLQERRAQGAGTSAAYKAIREKVEMMENDRAFDAEEKTAAALIGEGALLAAVESAVGELA